MPYLLHLLIGWAVIGASAACAYQLSRMAHESTGKHESGHSVKAAECSRLLGFSRSVLPRSDASLHKPFRLAHRGKMALGRRIADKLRARIATGLLHDSLRSHSNDEQRFEFNE